MSKRRKASTAVRDRRFRPRRRAESFKPSSAVQGNRRLRRARSYPPDQQYTPGGAVLHRKPLGGVLAHAGVRRSSARPGSARNRLLRGPILRGGNLLSQRRQLAGLSTASVPVSRRNAREDRKAGVRSLCQKKASARRAVIIATGHGGLNGVRTYKKKETNKCRD